MGILEIEWDFGKSKADKTIIWIFGTIYFFAYHYVKIFIDNYKRFRSKSKIPGFTSIDFHKRFFPGFFLFVIAPLVFIFAGIYYLPSSVASILTAVCAIAISLFLLTNFIYFIYRIIIDFSVSAFYLIKSFFVTTIYFIKFLWNQKRA